MDDELVRQVRVIHSATEMTHSTMYLGMPEVTEAWTALGLEPLAQGYVAGRAAPMGRVGPEVVAAAFYNFSPALVHAALPAAWEVVSPDDVLAARADAMERFWTRIEAPTEGREEVTAILRRAGEAAVTAGRPLAAANAGVPAPGTPWADWWQALAVLREHRGDGHVTALVAAEIGPVEALVLGGAWQANLSRRFLQMTRAWDDEAFAAAERRLEARGWWADGDLTAAGRAARDELETATDVLASGPWRAVSLDEREQVFRFGCRLLEALNAAKAFKREVPVPDRLP